MQPLSLKVLGGSQQRGNTCLLPIFKQRWFKYASSHKLHPSCCSPQPYQLMGSMAATLD